MKRNEHEDPFRRRLWSGASEHDGGQPGPQFVQDVLKQASKKVTIREYLFVFLNGFLGILLGILDVIPKKAKQRQRRAEHELLD